MTVTATLIVAAGRGSRFGGATPKQYARLSGTSVLRRTLDAFTRHPRIAASLAVIHPDDAALYDEAAQGLGLPAPIHGGATRQASVRAGLEALAAIRPDRVLVHDGARPLVSAATITRVVDALDTAPAVLPVLPVVDTLKRSSDGGRVTGTVERAGLWRAQTPQGFAFAGILDAHRRFAALDLSDDAALAERAGIPVILVPGEEDNLKITAQDDLTRAERILAAGMETRTGTGFDVHRFGEGDAVTLCGVRIAHGRGLQGHSDADVGLHALTDAILGAIAAEDIGAHFPPGDARWRGADSAHFLAHAAGLVRARGGAIVNVDVTLICEAPRVGPHREKMRARLAEILDIDIARCSVKATTTEGLGAFGRREGIGAQAAATLRMPALP
jgi:2-C-methyl-D-erythritol 4-phosphate cytidylyltransferase/2-C-methyl-D-erythritol 2,4-cyclodiphosphate synthase